MELDYDVPRRINSACGRREGRGMIVVMHLVVSGTKGDTAIRRMTCPEPNCTNGWVPGFSARV